MTNSIKMIFNQKVIAIILFSLFINLDTYGQEDDDNDQEIQETEVIIEKDRKIELNKETKLYQFIKWKPEHTQYKPENEGEYKVFNYDLTKEKEEYIPATTTVTKQETTYLQYLKAGLGNYNSPLIDLNLVTPKDANEMLSFNYKHLSFGKGEIDGKNSASSTNDLSLNGTKIWDRVKTIADIGFRSDINYYYGYSDGDAISRSSIKKNNRFFNAGVVVEDNNLNDDWSYEIGGMYKRFDDNYSNFESTLEVNGDFKYQDSYYIKAAVALSNLNSVSNSRSYFGVTPFYRFDVVGLNIDGGLSISGQSDDVGDLTQFKVFPYISATYDLSDDYQGFFTLDGGYDFNTLYEFSDVIPYLNSVNTIENTENQMLLYAGIRGNINDQWNTELKLGTKSVQNLPIYVNNSIDESLLDVVYDDTSITIVSIGLSSQYYLDESHDILFSFNYNHYSQGTYMPYHLPVIELSLKGHHELYQDWSLQWQYTLLSGITAFDSINDTDVDLEAINKLDLSVHYQIKERLGAFISGDNLIGKSYSRYYRYPQRGLQIKAGVTYRF